MDIVGEELARMDKENRDKLVEMLAYRYGNRELEELGAILDAARAYAADDLSDLIFLARRIIDPIEGDDDVK